MEIVKDVAAIIGCLLSFISLITFCTKGGRNVVRIFFLKNTKELVQTNVQQSNDIEAIKESLERLATQVNSLEESAKQQHRDTIKEIYYKYLPTKQIPLYERKAADINYEIYTSRYGGNSYATMLHDEIKKWKILTVGYEE